MPLHQSQAIYLWLLLSAFLHYLGPGLAYLLFEYTGELGMALIRNGTSALVLVFVLMKYRANWAEVKSLLPAGFVLGICLAIMNVAFYRAISLIPLSTVAAIEFLAPVIIALLHSKNLLNVIAIIISMLGVNLLLGAQYGSAVNGILWALLNAACFGVYILSVQKIAQTTKVPNLPLLGLAFMFSTMAILPFGLSELAAMPFDPSLLFLCLAVGLMSSLLPYICDQLVMQRLNKQNVSIYLAILPLMATLVSAFLLQQIPTLFEFAGILMVVLAVSLHQPSNTNTVTPSKETTCNTKN